MDSLHGRETDAATTTATIGLFKITEKYPAATKFVDTYSTAIKAVTGVGFVAHYLRIRKAIDAQSETTTTSHSAQKKLSPVRRAGLAGLGWSLVWVGILSATTLAEEAIHRRIDPVAISRKHKESWDVALVDKEELA